jgi:hypothetical protein
MTSVAYERVFDALTAHGSQSRDVRQNRAMFQCPAHADNNPSLEIIDKSDKVILACYAGCQNDDVIAALGLEWGDLFDNDLTTYARTSETLVRSYLYERVDGQPWFYVDRYFPKVFRQRLPGVEPVRSLDADTRGLGLKGRPPIVYHAPRVRRAIQRGGAVVWWLDGEKDVERAEREGLVATCAPGFAKWEPKYADFLKDADEIVMVVDQDKEKPDGRLGAGQQAAQDARAGFRSVGLKVRVLAPAAGKDLSDHFDAGFGVDDFTLEPTAYTRPRGMTAETLQQQTFDPLQWAVHGVIPSGLTVFAGSPKVGKTWLALELSLAVAAGGPALSALRTTQGSVLHLAREDGYRRLQSRLELITAGERAPAALELVSTEQEWVGGEEGIANMTEWAEEVRDPRMVVIDTIAKVEPEMGEGDRSRGAYAGNYAMMARYKAWADLHNCSVVMIHHDNKTKVEAGSDPFSRISGTRGITGAADTLLFLHSVRGTREGILHVTGRDVAEQELMLYKTGPLWNSLDSAEEH